jgi:dipeptidyl aminopeptidase/acylaminoacyl peptidase
MNIRLRKYTYRLVKILLLVFIIRSSMMSSLNAENGYKLPSENLQKIFDKPALPSFYYIPFSDLGMEMNYQDKQTLEQLADPIVKLAGKVLSQRLNAPIDHYPHTSMKICNFNENTEIEIDFKLDIKIRDHKLSPDRSRIAIAVESGQGIELMIVEVESGRISTINDILVNDIFRDSGFFWLTDNRTLIVKSIPADRGKVPDKPLTPESPVIEETSGKFSTTRTYQHLLQNNYDKLLFDYYFTSQIIRLNAESGRQEKLNLPGIYDEVKISPDNQYLLIEKIEKPYSYHVPHFRFPHSFVIWDINGRELKNVYRRSLQDQIPIGGTYQGPRRFEWQPLKDASLIWVEALDMGDPKMEVEYRDKVVRLPAPFNQEPELLFKVENRLSSLIWSEREDELIFTDYDRDKMWRKTWYYRILDEHKKMIISRNVNDEYNYNGSLITRKTDRNMNVYLHRNSCVYFNNIYGSTPDGNKPFLAKFNLDNQKKEILFRSSKDQYERMFCFTDNQLNRIIIRSEDKEHPRNYFFLDLTTGKREPITNYENPYPEITGLKKELITYRRKDNVPLSGTLYLPEDYQEGDKLPLVLHAYPQEFTDKSTAGQVTTSPNKFISFWGASPIYFALEGYAVLMNTSIPIIGDPETVNESFIDQLTESVKAAVDHLDTLGVIDPERVGIIGHSYGAFMVANLLAHSDICKAGIAKSGAYNRTLTPFGFQSERRTLWEATDFYVDISPFMHADDIDKPLLLIHGEEDPNSGTFPLQSKRLYQALKGTGGTARLIILPHEGHSYHARESNLHILAEFIEWFDKYLK